MSNWIDAQDQTKVNSNLAKLRDRGGLIWDECLSYAGGDERFALWVHYVNRRITARIGLTMFDIADWCSRDAYDAGLTPAEGAQEALDSDDLYADSGL